MAGSISTLGVGSGLELQSILDQLRDVDQAVVDRKKADISRFESQLEEFTVVKNKLFDLKGIALDLSLSSSFLGRTVSSSDGDVVSATVSDGATVQSSAITVSNLAAKSSWMSDSGFASSDAIVYVPTSQQGATGVLTTDPGTPLDDAYFTTDDTLRMTYGSGGTLQTISVAVGPTSGIESLNELKDAINNDDENGNGSPASLYVTADIITVGGEYSLQISSTAAGPGESNRVMITGQLDQLALTAPNIAFSYQLGGDSEKTASITVPADTTLSELAALINEDNDNQDVTATVINDGVDPDSPYKLVLQADSTGEDNRISFITQLPDITMEESAEQAVADSLNAQFTLDGIFYHRQSNTVSDVISGVSLTLKAESSATLSIANNDTALAEKITAMVEAYNDIVQEISSNSSYDEDSKEFGILSGTTLRSLPSELQNLMSLTITADSEKIIGNMFDLGLEFDRDGVITINQETLTAAIASNRSNVEAFFLGDVEEGIDGFADTVNDRLRYLTGSSGSLDGEKNSAQARIDDLELTFEEESARLEKKYALLAKRFVALDQYMSQMTSISNFLTSQFEGAASNWGGTSKS